MKIIQRIILLVCEAVFVAFVLTTPCKVFADTESGIPPYSVETADKKYIFVMLKGGYVEDSYLYHSDKYPQSGMYRNNGSTIPLWTVDWSAHVFLPSDGIHVVRKGRWGRTGNYDEEAISFFANGELLKTYRVKDLVDFPWLLPQTASHYQWQKSLLVDGQPVTSTLLLLDAEPVMSVEFESGVLFDEASHTLKLGTLQGDMYVFDLKTGAILSARRPVRSIIIIAISCVLLIGIIVVLIRKRKKRRQRTY